MGLSDHQLVRVRVVQYTASGNVRQVDNYLTTSHPRAGEHFRVGDDCFAVVTVEHYTKSGQACVDVLISSRDSYRSQISPKRPSRKRRPPSE